MAGSLPQTEREAALADLLRPWYANHPGEEPPPGLIPRSLHPQPEDTTTRALRTGAGAECARVVTNTNYDYGMESVVSSPTSSLRHEQGSQAGTREAHSVNQQAIQARTHNTCLNGEVSKADTIRLSARHFAQDRPTVKRGKWLDADQLADLAAGYAAITGQGLRSQSQRGLLGQVYTVHGEDTLSLTQSLFDSTGSYVNLLGKLRAHPPRTDRGDPPQHHTHRNDDADGLDGLVW